MILQLSMRMRIWLHLQSVLTVYRILVYDRSVVVVAYGRPARATERAPRLPPLALQLTAELCGAL